MTSGTTRLALKRHQRLNNRARQLAQSYVPEVLTMDWVCLYRPVVTVWGQCDRGQHLITIADACRVQPFYVEDFVIVHELTHLIHPNHDADFHAVVNRYPKAAKAAHHLKLEIPK